MLADCVDAGRCRYRVATDVMRCAGVELEISYADKMSGICQLFGESPFEGDAALPEKMY